MLVDIQPKLKDMSFPVKAGVEGTMLEFMVFKASLFQTLAF